MKNVLLISLIIMFSGCSIATNYCKNKESNTLAYSLYQINPYAYEGLDSLCNGLEKVNKAKNIYNKLVDNNFSK